jgi:hypothetical protein
MKTSRIIIAVLGLLFGNHSSGVADVHSLKGRSSVDLEVGLWHESKAGNANSSIGVAQTASTGGFLGGLSYHHWFQEEFSFEVSIGLLAGEATSLMSVSGSLQRTSSVVPVLFGVCYHLTDASLKSSVRPFVSLSMGPFLGFESQSELLKQETHTETALGARFGAGMDFLAGQSFKIGAGIGYTVMMDYSTSIGARKNYSGPDFQLSVGLLFGESEP